MQVTHPSAMVTISVTEFDMLIRRAVREAVPDELKRLLRTDATEMVDDWTQEGVEDEEGDKVLLTEALQVLNEREKDKSAWQSWEQYKVNRQ